MNELNDYIDVKKQLTEIINSFEQLINGTSGYSNVNWMLAVNTGALLWYVGILDKFTINDVLVFKWWVILTIIFLLFPLITLYRIRMVMMNYNLELMNVKAKLKNEKFDKTDFVRLFNTGKLMPSTKTGYFADFLFLIGIVSMVAYIITYFMKYK